ncbi:MAG TPA: TIGR03560 family F420-dependent LLM class oxidoreductase [Acidimicrobiia bacterium]
MSASLKVGAFIPQGWKLEYSGVDAATAWARSKEIAQLAEKIGYDHLWVYDHVETVPRREPTHVFEAFTTLAAIAQHTTRVGLGQLVTCAAYRNPGLLAKTAACVDVMSDGRLVFGIGAGWFQREYQAYGYDFPSAGTRLAILEESIEVIKRMWSEETVSYAGKHFAFDGAYCDPKPLQSSPQFWVGGGGERKTLRIAAKHATHTNWQVGLPEFEHKSKVLAQHCADVGRDFDSIVRTHGPDCRLFDTEADLKKWLDAVGGGLNGKTPHDEYIANHFVGTVDMVSEQVRGFIAAGCGEVVLWFRDYPSSESLERFIAEVVPNLD